MGIGTALWNLLKLEHGADFDFSQEHIDSFFQETISGKFIPRCVFFDTDLADLEDAKN
jgi:hypothetical protein